jgi:hypothetical protein
VGLTLTCCQGGSSRLALGVLDSEGVHRILGLA